MNKAIALFLFMIVVFSFTAQVNAADCPDGSKLPDCYRLDNPLGATDSIPSLICKVLSFLSEMVMPPVFFC